MPRPDGQTPGASAPSRPYLYARLMRIDRPIGTLLLLWPTLWALWIAAAGRPAPNIALVFVLGVFVMRSAGCVVNDILDRELDAAVARTRGRPLARKLLPVREAWALFAALLLVALALVLTLNWLTIGLAFAGVALALTYPLMKRLIHLPQLYLGVAFGWGIPMAFAAETGAIPPVAWALLAGNILWTLSYDTMYAMTDRDDDIRFGSLSSAILFGRADRIWTAGFQLAMLTTMALVGHSLGFGAAYHVGLAAAAGFAAYQQYLIRDREPSLCFRAFLNNNWLGAAVFAGVWLETTL